MSPVTGKQLVALNRIFTDGDNTSSQKMQKILDSGLLNYLRDANIDDVDHSNFRKVLDLPPMFANDFPTWMTVKLGVHKTPESYREAFKLNRVGVGWFNEDLSEFSISSEEIEIELIRVTVAELGFKTGAGRSSICKKAKKLGFELCPREVILALSLDYQPSNERVKEIFTVVTKPLKSFEELDLLGIIIACDNTRSIRPYRHLYPLSQFLARPEVPADEILIFARCKAKV